MGSGEARAIVILLGIDIGGRGKDIGKIVGWHCFILSNKRVLILLWFF